MSAPVGRAQAPKPWHPPWRPLCNCVRDDLIEHSAESRTIDHAGLHGEADDSAGELIHHDHDPVGREDQRFAAKEIDAPQAIFGMPEEREPRWTIRVVGRPIAFRKHRALGAGMLPIALGLGADPSFRSPMAVTVIGGLMTSTFLSLLVIPVIYSWVDDLVQWMRNLSQR